MVSGFFPQARGIKTATHTMEISIKRDGKLERVLIFDDCNDPYQMHPIDPQDNPQLFESLLTELSAKLEETDDIWYRNEIISNLKF